MGCLGVWALSVLLGSSLWLAYGVRASAGSGATVKGLQEGLQVVVHFIFFCCSCSGTRLSFRVGLDLTKLTKSKPV